MKIIINFGKVLIRKGNVTRMSVKIDGVYSLNVNDKLYIVYNLKMSNNKFFFSFFGEGIWSTLLRKTSRIS